MSRRSSKFGTRIKSANRSNRARESGGMKERLNTASVANRSELTHQNLREFEEKLSSQAPSVRRDKIIFSDKHVTKSKKVDGELTQKVDEEMKDDQMEGEGENDAENPNEAENLQFEEVQDQDAISIKSRSEVQSMSKFSRKSYVESLRNELRREREKREELEKQVKELTESR